MSQDSQAPVATSDFKEALSRWASGVAVVSVRDAEGLCAATVSSFSSLSLEPALVLVALKENSRTLKRVEAAGRFTVSVLSSTQREVAASCASGAPDTAAFDENAWVRDSLVGLSCSLHELRRYGDHLLVVGQVRSVQRGVEAEPLLYWNRAYRAVTALPPAGPGPLPSR
ncbi:flavin reductase [Pyxidicoccus fallax]|uniref:Flavin reductase n=1 Tax=Pyxidicoccus fallax TaxID=394095 RepID=A0A848LCE2_9BACT|nr:flavin reductase family protein [Pyxidicoccus fallax]NMO16134.1 flavin reductase [Pyxidicoccus fallax]NPC83203.1 flavin reductase [Pyxidicoccus fallax]